MHTESHQIMGELRIAAEQLAYCKTIMDYPKTKFAGNLDTSSPRDVFYRNTAMAFFHQSIIGTAGVMGSDTRVISFLNWPDFMEAHAEEVKVIRQSFYDCGFAPLRDQVVAHADMAHPANRFSHMKHQMAISDEAIEKLEEIQSQLINLFMKFTRFIGQEYAPENFSTYEAALRVEDVMDNASPKMTNAPLI